MDPSFSRITKISGKYHHFITYGHNNNNNNKNSGIKTKKKQRFFFIMQNCSNGNQLSVRKKNIYIGIYL